MLLDCCNCGGDEGDYGVGVDVCVVVGCTLVYDAYVLSMITRLNPTNG